MSLWVWFILSFIAGFVTTWLATMDEEIPSIIFLDE